MASALGVTRSFLRRVTDEQSPSDPAWRPHAEAALKAVKGCDPLHVPDKYAEYYPSWKSRTVYFDPTRN